MRTRKFRDLGDREVVRTLISRSAQERHVTADVLALIAELDERRLYRQEGYPSTFDFCVQALHLSDDEAYKRIQVARACSEFPSLLEAIADGRLHLTGARMLAPRLTGETVDELLSAATHKTKPQIEELLAQRFPQTEAMPLVMTVPSALVPVVATSNVQPGSCQLVPGPVEERSKVAPIAPKRFMLQLMMDEGMRERLRYAQELMSHQIPSGDPQEVLDQALKLLIMWAEKRRFAATDKPRQAARPATAARTIPAEVRRVVWKRDGGRCTYCNDNGQRCPARTRIEFDHIVPVARGGESTVENIRLRCHPHNQLAAEQEFGAGFMENKRKAAKEGRAETQKARANEQDSDRDVVPWLRALGIKADQARDLAAVCDDIPDAPLEERLRRALSHHGARLACRGQMAACRAAPPDRTPTARVCGPSPATSTVAAC